MEDTNQQPEAQCDQILFDGTCGVCQRSIKFVNKHDQNGAFKFEPLEGGAAADTVVFRAADGTVYTKSSAVIQVLKRLGGAWQVLGWLLACLPVPIRDWMYDWVARHRHLYGRHVSI